MSSGPEKLALISDIHGNSPALRAVLDDILQHECSLLIVLGDIINGVDPQGCIKLLRAWQNILCIRGNAEAYILTPDLDGLPGRDEPMNAGLIRLVQWLKSHLEQADLDWIESFPDWEIRDGLCFVHDSPLDRLYPNRWHIPDLDRKYQEWFYHARGITLDMPDNQWKELVVFMDQKDLSHVFCAHTHSPFYRQVGSKFIYNTGSVGMPLDSDPRASWVMVEKFPQDERISKPRFAVTIQRVFYNIADTLLLIDHTPDYPDFAKPGMKETYKRMFQTGVFWRAHLK
jgi:predicted phosphodiesterase